LTCAGGRADGRRIPGNLHLWSGAPHYYRRFAVTTGWTKKTIIILVLAWIPFVLFMGAIILLMMSYFNGGNLARPLLICAIVILPLVLLGVLYYFIQRFIRHLRE
jgi:hypothetical protein